MKYSESKTKPNLRISFPNDYFFEVDGKEFLHLFYEGNFPVAICENCDVCGFAANMFMGTTCNDCVDKEVEED